MGCKQSKEKEDEEPKQEEQGEQEAAADGEETGKPETEKTAEEPTQQDDKPADAAKIIVVFGATGNQGGSVVKAMQADSQYKIRAVTRNPDSDKGKALAEAGTTISFLLN